MVNPFSLKTVFLARHAQHVVLIHFPIALFIAAVAFDCLAQWTKNHTLAAALRILALEDDLATERALTARLHERLAGQDQQDER